VLCTVHSMSLHENLRDAFSHIDQKLSDPVVLQKCMQFCCWCVFLLPRYNWSSAKSRRERERERERECVSFFPFLLDVVTV
jgi:hypothetical protein